MRVATSVFETLDCDHVVGISLLTFSGVEDRKHVCSSGVERSLESVNMSELFDMRFHGPL